MHITYIGLSYYPPQIWKIDLLKISNEASKDTNNQVTIFAKRRKWEPFMEKRKNKTIYRLFSISENSVIDEFIYIFIIPYLLKKNKIIVDIFHIYNPFFLVSILNIFLRIIYPKSDIIFDIRTWPLKEWVKKILNYFLITLWHITASKTIIVHKNLLRNFFYIKKWSTNELAIGFEKSNSLHIKTGSSSKRYIYIGSIYPRREIWNMLDAFEKYLLIYSTDTLTLLWWGDPTYVETLKKRYSCKNIIFLGSVKQEDVQKYLFDSDYWIAYVPMTSYFMDQPPLKTIEYLGTWIPVIGTQTHGNELFIKKNNGILVADWPQEFMKWLVLFREKFSNYDPIRIQESIKQYEWKNIYAYLKSTIYSGTMDD